MLVQGQPRLTIEPLPGSDGVRILDQTLLPHCIEWRELRDLDSVCEAIVTMRVRGAPLIGVTAAFGMAIAARQDDSDNCLRAAADRLLATRPTAVNLRWAVQRMLDRASSAKPWDEALTILKEDIAANESLGRHGAEVLRALHTAKLARGDSTPLQIMTHCNAGWLAAVDRGTALSPIYAAHEQGLPLHVWVSETRPRNQGAALTAWELHQQRVPHTLIADNNAGHLMQHGLVDACIVGADRVTSRGDAANKIGTYLKALAAKANAVPFYVAMPFSTIDWTLNDGVKDIPIEQRSAREVTHVHGLTRDGTPTQVLVCPAETQARNDAFDVTPAELITAFITERGLRHAPLLP